MPNKINIRQRQMVYRKAIERFGPPNQMIKAIEEMSELTKVLAKILVMGGEVSLDELIEEVADVTIMMEQLRLIYNINDEVCEMMDGKVKRLEGRVK
ncbi:MAG: hypothetical protein E7432_04270 [Ruminococcaceae bacterium]|nr:hypothetical protein [Oscillospiraceae bacterium]